MTAAKLASKQNRRRKALRVLGLAGVSLSLAGGASASTVVRVRLPHVTAPPHVARYRRGEKPGVETEIQC